MVILQIASFVFTVWVCGFVYGLFDSSIRMNWLNAFPWVCVALSVALVLAIRGYHLWKWALPGARIGSLFLAVGHIGLLAGCLIYASMSRAGQGSGLLLVLPALWCISLYPTGLGVIVLAFVKEFRSARPAVPAAQLVARADVGAHL